MKQQLLVINRARRRAPNLSALDQCRFGFWSFFLDPRRIGRVTVIIRPSTLLKLHSLLKQRKYRLLYSSGKNGKPGPKGPSQELIQAIVAWKQRNPRFGCPRIAQQINKAFSIDIDKDLVRRVLAAYYRPGSGMSGPSWPSFLGHTEDNLWSIDLFRYESVYLNSQSMVMVMDQFSRRIIGFGVHAGDVDGLALCHIFNTVIFTKGPPYDLGSDNDPLFRYHRWQANLRILEIQEIKTVPYMPLSHPFIERLTGTLHREFLDHVFFWKTNDLEAKPEGFQQYYNAHRVHTSLDGNTPSETTGETTNRRDNLNQFQWKSHCSGLYQLPVAARGHL